MGYLYNGILLGKYQLITDTHNRINESGQINFKKRSRTDTEEYILYDFIYMTFKKLKNKSMVIEQRFLLKGRIDFKAS